MAEQIKNIDRSTTAVRISKDLHKKISIYTTISGKTMYKFVEETLAKIIDPLLKEELNKLGLNNGRFEFEKNKESKQAIELLDRK